MIKAVIQGRRRQDSICGLKGIVLIVGAFLWGCSSPAPPPNLPPPEYEPPRSLDIPAPAFEESSWPEEEPEAPMAPASDDLDAGTEDMTEADATSGEGLD